MCFDSVGNLKTYQIFPLATVVDFEYWRRCDLRRHDVTVIIWLSGIVALGPLTEVYAPAEIEQKNYPNAILRPMAGTLRPAPWASTKHKTAMVGLCIDGTPPVHCVIIHPRYVKIGW